MDMQACIGFETGA